MDVQKKLDDIVEAIGSARSLPMSASCVVNRADLLSRLEEVRQALPGSLAQARELIGDREQLVAQARREAERIIESAHAERGSLISDTLVARQSKDEAERILAQAREEADEIRAEADEYVDSKLANFEVVLSKTIGSVDRGREKLLGWRPGADAPDPAGHQGREAAAGTDTMNAADMVYAVDAHSDPQRPSDAPGRAVGPAALVQQADAYVDAKLRAFETVLTKTLEAVGRGRSKIHGPAVDGSLGDHMAAQDAAAVTQHNGDTSDADYLAGLAELAENETGLSSRARHPRPAPAPALNPPLPPIPSAPERPRYEPDTAFAVPGAGAQPSPARPWDEPGAPYEPAAPAAHEPWPQQSPGWAPGAHPTETGASTPNQVDPAAGRTPHQRAYGDQAADPLAGYQPQIPRDPYPSAEPGAHQARQARPQAGALDETSLFDTGMIDLDQLRPYDEGR
ncbi:cell division initiation protein [Streptomyces sp. NBC_00690]|uniref:cell division initiation protein n=1 Tax=Streptomyces sp. NBC_00690 TaxID=2975808 RepID=UPI002E2BD455|nr:cell division initiation protein [Streptomyces sp. NBC_00690]